MKSIIKYIPWIVLVIGAIFFVKQCNKPAEVEYVVKEVTVEVPVVEHVFDTIIEPKTYPVVVTEIDSTLYEQYQQLKDSIAKDSLFKEAIAIRGYSQTFEDSIQTIDVYSKTRGSLLEQSVKYKTKPRTITTIDSIPIKKKMSLSIGSELGMPTIQSLGGSVVLKGNLVFKNKKDNTFSISYDTEGRVWVGKSWKIL